VVFSHFWMSGLASVHAASAIGVPVAHTFHALGVVKRRHQGAHDTSPAARVELETTIGQCADRVIATSAAEQRELEALGVDPARVRVIPCGVDLERFTPRGPRAPRDPRRPRVLVLSRLVERKGIGNVIEAVAQLPGVELLIAGGPPAALVDDDVEACRFTALARDLGVDDRVELLGGVERERVPALIRSSDVVVCCPWYEPFGIVAVEAMACGVPVVASDVGGLGETVVDGVTGLHVPARAPHRIAAALATLLASAGFRRRLGEAGVRRAQRYGWRRVAGETYDALAELVCTPSYVAIRRAANARS
jgi:glycosyltransferase involved in cell wall biosynthesis